MASSLDSSRAVRSWPARSDIREALGGLDPAVLTEGQEVSLLEAEAEAVLAPGREFVAVSGGTQAIEVGLRALGIGPGDRVLLPAFTFAGTLIPVLAIGATPVLADVDPRTYNLSPETVEAVPHLWHSMIAVHLHGLMAPVDDLRLSFGGDLLEDSCQAYGASIGNLRAGTVGAASAWSLNQTKTVFAGEGGLVAFEEFDPAVDAARSLRKFGFPEGEQVARSYGSNWKLPEISARIARFSLRRLPERLRNASVAANELSSSLEGVEWLSAPYVPDGYVHAWHKYRVRIEDPDVTVDHALERLTAAGVPACRWGTLPLHLHPAYRDHVEWGGPGSLHVSEEIPERTLIIGHEQEPLCSWDPPRATEVAAQLREVTR